MAGRIVVFGATGYTGGLVSGALVKRGVRPVLAARSEEKLAALADELGGGLETRTADVSEPAGVRALVERGDVLVSTVGPFIRWGAPAVEAAIAAGAHYIDSTGEPPFIRRVFEEWGPQAERAGCGLLTAFGYDYVPGNLAGGLVLDRAGEKARKVAVGYFLKGVGRSMGDAASGGTLASLGGVIAEHHFAFRDGRLVSERSAKRVRSFAFAGRDLTGISIGSTEHFTLPRIRPELREVDAYLGWFGPASRGMQVFSLTTELPGVRAAIGALSGRLLKGSTGGPDEETRAKSGSLFAAEAYGEDGRPIGRVTLEGPNHYTLTGEVMAWAAQRAAEHGLEGSGALGPVDGFGLQALEAGCAEIGLAEMG